MKKFFKDLIVVIIIIIITYSFLGLCNWNLYVGEWNGFSRFFIGIIGFLLIFNLATRY